MQIREASLQIAVIGLGEVGRCYTESLLEAGHTLRLCEPFPSPAAKELAQRLRTPIEAASGAWLGSSETVLSCVTGSHALSVVTAAASHLPEGAIFADLTTASPQTKREAAQHAARFGIRYVDVAIMGAISLSRAKTPLLAAGHGADELRSMLERIGCRIKVIANGDAGDAVSLKILRSVFTKGMEALAVELLVGAEKQGVRDKLYEQLSDIDETPLRSFLEMLVRTHVVHAGRRELEVGAAAAELSTQGLPSLVLPGVEARFRNTRMALIASALATPDPSIDEALSWLLRNASPTVINDETQEIER